jgi:hypothetical protein
MVDLTVLVKSVLESEDKTTDIFRIASDWKRQHLDLCRAWKNRTGKEIFLVRKFACAVCSEKDSGLICVECIADASRGDSHATEEIATAEASLEDMANG